MVSTTESTLTSLAAGQWGMLTAAQASAAGIARSTLLRREQSGSLERLRTGVYRVAGAPADPADPVRAAWLAANPAVVARDRRDHPDTVVGGAAAASVHGIGDLSPSPYTLYTTARRRSRHDDVRYRSRSLPARDVMILDGLPVTIRECTIADLLDEPGADVSIVADALRDAETNSARLDLGSLVAHLEPHAKRLGHVDGTALYGHLRSLARIDEVRLRDLLEHTDIADQISAALEAQLEQVLAPFTEKLDRQMREAVDPTVRSSTALRSSMSTLDGLLPKIVGPKVTLPPGLLPTITLPGTVRATLDRLAGLAFPMSESDPSREPRRSMSSAQPEERDDQ